ncbi:uncharacterized protein [Venturia canescens]|uniref:uncharacterized protein n=1 Tax=Venturia canescens TaxID=32260 RepID=UPI001C9C9AE9|nr:uncharacterized protein LOC122417710 [Venturia canescens]
MNKIKMGRPARVSTEEAIRVVEKYIEHFKTNEMPPSGSPVWRQMSKDLDKRWLPHSVYTSVRENKKGILSSARLRQGITVPVPVKTRNTPHVRTYSSEEEVEEDPTENRVTAPSESLMSWYFLSLDGEIWNEVKPKNLFEFSLKLDKYELRVPTEWTDAIFDAFFEAFHFPCVYMLKHVKVYNSQNSLHYMHIYAECKSQKCSNRFMGYVEDEPWAGEALEINIKTWDTSLDEHENVRRPVRAIKKRVLDDDEGTNDRKRRPGEKHGIDIETEEVRILKRLMEMYRHDESIRGIGLVPSHYTYYTPPEQIQAYNQYCQQESSSIKIDVRKGFVKRINRAHNLKSGDIYLISMLFNYKGRIFPAYQMTSETRDYLSIWNWLEAWMAKGAIRPKEAVSNYCRVFLAAMCKAFNGFSLEQYISSELASVSSNESSDDEWRMSPPRTRIRVDTKDLLHVVSQWRCFENVYHPCIRRFYVQCVDLLIRAQSFIEFSELLFFIIVTAVSMYEDDLLEANKLTPKVIRKRLDAVIASHKHHIEIAPYNRQNDREKEQPVLENYLIHESELTPVTMWIDEIVKEAKLLKKQGSQVNAFYVPQFADQLIALALDFPLWTSFARLTQRTTTWELDEYFKDWEPRLFAEIPSLDQFPIRADRFVKAHLQEINESVKSLRSLMENSETERISTDGMLKFKYSGNNVEVTVLHEKDTSSLTEYLDLDKNGTPENDLIVDPVEFPPTEPKSGENSPAKAPPVDNMFSTYVVETGELDISHQKNISLNFSEV